MVLLYGEFTQGQHSGAVVTEQCQGPGSKDLILRCISIVQWVELPWTSMFSLAKAIEKQKLG